MSGNKKVLLTAAVLALFAGTQITSNTAVSASEIQAAILSEITVSRSNSFSTLKDAVTSTELSRVYELSADENLTSGLDTMGGTNSVLTINGNTYNINANGNYDVNVLNGQTLNINKVGNITDELSNGLNGFHSSNGGVIYNRGSVNISDSIFSNNTVDFDGGAIYNESGVINIVDSIFKNNGTTGSGYGGAIYNADTINIVSANSETLFENNVGTGSDAIYNKGTVNLNAGGHNIVFNDSIGGNSASVININNENVQIGGDATNPEYAPTSGIVEINSNVWGNTINLYNGTLKIGSLKNGHFEDTVNFNVYGGMIDLIDETIREVNLGNITLQNNTGLAIDLGTNNASDKITGNLLNSNGYNFIISKINADESTFTSYFESQVADDNLKSAVTLSAGAIDPSITGLFSYDKADGMLTYNSSTTLNDAVTSTETDRIYNITSDTDIYKGFDGMGGSSLTINGNQYNVNGNGYYDLSTSNNQTLTINDVGDRTSENASGFNNFKSINGGVIYSRGNTVITNSVFSNNSSDDDGGAVFNDNGTLSIDNSDFINNVANSDGGAILNLNTTTTINGSSFINNKAYNRDGGAIHNQEGTIFVNDTIFSGNYAIYNGGAIANQGTGTIIDSTFLGNSAEWGGAILHQYNNTLNIVADKKDTVFTGNTDSTGSNALRNNEDSVTNMNASDQGSIIFNDKITGEYEHDNTVININKENVQIGGDIATPEYAPTTGVIEFNNTVSDNTINLYNGTLKLGSYSGGVVNGVDVAASTGSLSDNVKLYVYGGKIDLSGNGVTENPVTLGNVTLNSNLSLSIDADLANEKSDMISSPSAITDNGYNIEISGIRIISDASKDIVQTTVADGNLKDSIILATNAQIDKDAGVNKNYLISYDNTGSSGILTFDSTNNLVNAVRITTPSRVYTMNTEELVSETPGLMGGGEGAVLTINANGNDITANGSDIGGIVVGENQTLNINNVGSEGSNGFNGFSGYYWEPSIILRNGGVVNNSDGLLNISNSYFTNNVAYNGGAVTNDGGKTIIQNSIFEGNEAGYAGGAFYGWDGQTTTIIDSTFINNSAGNSGGAIVLQNGTLNLVADKADTVFTGNTDSTGSNGLYLFQFRGNDAPIANINAGSGRVIFNDGIDGKNTDDNVININKENVQINFDDANPEYAPTTGVVEINNEVKNNTINMYNGTLRFGTNTQNGVDYTGTFADSVKFNYYGGNISLQNGEINSTNLGNLNLYSDMNLMLDANFADKTIDTITATNFIDNGNKINISNIRLLAPTEDEYFSISPLGTNMPDAVKTALAGAIQYTGGEIVYSPIYKYSASYDPLTALLNFGLAGGGNDGYENFSPSVVASPVAAQLGGYLSQLNSYDNAFRNMDMYMLMTKEQREFVKLRNKYASAADENVVFDPTITQYENKSGWFRPYATFENVGLHNGPRVSNVSYGSFFGGESEMYDLGHGWDGMWGVYMGYNGSHQAYDGVSIYQNGGTLGAVGMAYKGNFFTGLTANVGANAGEASSMFGHEDFAMLMAGVASKTGYNWELAKGKFIIQPSFLISYTFVNTFDYKNAAGVSISSDPLHAIQLEPGIKFIGNLKNGWQPYLGVSFIWNVMDRTHFQANDIALPNLSVDPFVKYGVGIRKAWGEKFTGYFQTYITNGGRNGVGLQFGFRWTLGKTDSDKYKSAKSTPEIQKTKIILNGIKG